MNKKKTYFVRCTIRITGIHDIEVWIGLDENSYRTIITTYKLQFVVIFICVVDVANNDIPHFRPTKKTKQEDEIAFLPIANGALSV